MKALSLNNGTVRYGNKEVLRDISVEIEGGDIFIIIGPNGSGKTTLLKTMAGLIKPDSGTVRVLGRPLTDYSRRHLARVLAMVPQQIPEDFPFTVAETVLMGRFPHRGITGMEDRRDREIAAEAMDFTDITHLAARTLNQLSGGERQRVIIARAICQQADIIVLDEPTASLDPAHQIKIMDLMERLRAERRTTVVMVSHDLNLAALYGDHLLLMQDGKIHTMGTPEHVLTYENLEKAYGCILLVDRNPLGKTPRVTPVPGKFLQNVPSNG